MNRELQLEYARPAAGKAPDLLFYEQEKWAPYTGLVTKANLVKMLARLLYGDRYQETIDCGMRDGGKSFVAVVHAYPLVPNLQFETHTTYGTLSEGVVEDYLHTEQVGIVYEEEKELEYPAMSVESVEWLGGIYNKNGRTVPARDLAVSGKKLYVGGQVCGTVKLSYWVRRTTFILSIEKREDAIENFYSAAVYGIYPGGIAFKEISAPPGAEAFAPDPDAVCGWTYRLRVTYHEKDPRPPKPDSPSDETRRVDFCTGEELGR